MTSQTELIRIYLSDIGKIALLNKEEEAALTRQLQETNTRLISRLGLLPISYGETIKIHHHYQTDPDFPLIKFLSTSRKKEIYAFSKEKILRYFDDYLLRFKKWADFVQNTCDDFTRSFQDPVSEASLTERAFFKLGYNPEFIQLLIQRFNEKMQYLLPRKIMNNSPEEPFNKSSPSISSQTIFMHRLLFPLSVLITLHQEISVLNEQLHKLKTRLIKSNLRLVASIAKKYSGKNFELLIDLIQEGNIGLIKAVDRYDSSKGTKFGTYATYWIEQSIIRSLQVQRTIRLPHHIYSVIKKINEYVRQYKEEKKRTPRPGTIARNLAINVEKVRLCLAANKSFLSMETTEDGRYESPQFLSKVMADEDYLSPIKEILHQYHSEKIQEALKILDERSRNIVFLKYGFNDAYREYSLEEIGNKYHLSRERVRQIINTALKTLRNCSCTKELKGLFNEFE